MTYDPSKHHRRSVRLQGYDYSQNGGYFITVCTRDKESLFGEVSDGKMLLNNLGRIVKDEWLKTAEMRHNIRLDEFVIMPNHVHGILIIQDAGDGRGTMHRAPTTEHFGKPSPNSIPTIVRGFKSAVTLKIKRIRHEYNVSVWQKNYYEHIIRNDMSLQKVREYITNNPMNWAQDELNQLDNCSRGTMHRAPTVTDVSMGEGS